MDKEAVEVFSSIRTIPKFYSARYEWRPVKCHQNIKLSLSLVRLGGNVEVEHAHIVKWQEDRYQVDFPLDSEELVRDSEERFDTLEEAIEVVVKELGLREEKVYGYVVLQEAPVGGLAVMQDDDGRMMSKDRDVAYTRLQDIASDIGVPESQLTLARVVEEKT